MILLSTAPETFPPKGAIQTDESGGVCPNGLVIYFQEFQGPGTQEYRLFGLIDPDGKRTPFLHIYGDGTRGDSKVVVMTPQGPKKTSLEKLMEVYPTPCDLAGGFKKATA